MKLILVALTLLWYYAAVMKIHEQTNQRKRDSSCLLSEDRGNGREEIKEADHPGTTEKDAGGTSIKKKRKLPEKPITMLGRTYGLLVALEIVGKDTHGRAMLKCKCACGGEAIAQANDIKNGHTSSCGCLVSQPRESPIFHDDGSVSISITKGKFTRIDGDDFERVSKFSWFETQGYASSNINGRVVRMQNFILPPPNGLIVDHKYGDRLDNRKSELRFGTQQQNTCNAAIRSHNTSGYKGVSWNKRAKKWAAYITSLGIRNHLGLFLNKEDAAMAYANEAKRLHGEFARIA